jgi:hypothetical protein
MMFLSHGKTYDGVTIQGNWAANDGIVPLASALYPECDAATAKNYEESIANGEIIEPGRWYYMETMEGTDHFDFCGTRDYPTTYDDFYFSSEESGEEGGDKEKMDFVQFLNDDSNLYDKSFEKNIWNEKYADFLNSLNESEHLFMKAVQDMDTQYYYDVNKFKVSNTYLKSKLGYDDSTYHMIINNIKKKYYQAFELSLNKEEHDSYKNKSNNELIF